MNPVALLRLLRDGPWRPWLDGVLLRVDAGEPLLVGVDRVLPYRGEPVDAEIELADEALRAMLDRRVPAGPVQMRLGSRDRPARLKQAQAVLALANLGWCGPWPDPGAASEHVTLVRDALWHVVAGPADELRPLFAAGAPLGLDRVALRLTHGATTTAVTCGLAELAGAELYWRGRDVPLRVLRRFALDATEAGHVAPRLDDFAVTRSRLPLPHAWCVLAALEPVRSGAPAP